MMKNTTWVFGSMLAAGCMLLSVPAAAQGNFPQGNFPQGNFPQGNFPQGNFPQGNFPQGNFPQQGNIPQQGAGRTAAPSTGKTAASGTKSAATTTKTNTSTTKSTTTAKSDKAALEAAKYQLSNHRTDLIKTTIDGYASSEDLSDSAVVRSIMEDIEKKMPLVPAVPLEKADLQELNNRAKEMVELEYGADDKKYASIVENEAMAEFPLYKIGDKVVVNYNMGPKHYSVKGTLYRVTENAITVEDKIINLVDLSDEIRARFDPRRNEYMRARYVETHIHLLNRIKIEKLQDYYDKLKGEIFKRNETAGYIYDPQTDRWSTAQELSKNYIDRLKARQQRAKQNTPKANDDAAGTTVAEQREPVKPATKKTEPAQEDEEETETVSSKTEAMPINDAIKIEDNAESAAKYKTVIAKAEKQKKDANENFAGIDADSGYKNACWGFTIGDARYALWHEPEFPFITPALGRDVITIPDTGLEVDIAGDPASIDLVYVSNSLSKVVYNMKDCSWEDFIIFKDSLNQQYGRAVEDKGSAFNNIFSGKTKPQQIADEDEIAKVKAAVKDAEKAFNKAVADLKNADDDERDELQEKRDQAAAVLKEANAKAEEYENAVTADNLPYVFSRIKLAKDSSGNTLLPYTFNWKGKNVTGTLVFYYDKNKDNVSSLVFAKEYKK